MFAAVFLTIGVLGFVPGITTHLDRLAFADRQTGAAILGVLGVSVWGNLVHLTFAAAGMMLARTAPGARAYLVSGATVYLALTVGGVITGVDGSVNAASLFTAGNWLHLALGVTMMAVGVLASRPPADTWHVGAGEGAQQRPIGH